MRTFSIASFVFFVISSILPNISFAQARTPESKTVFSGETNRPPFDVTSSWRITVSRNTRAQVPQIPDGVKGDDTKKFLLNAISAFTKGEIVKMNAELIETAQVRMLILTPATGNKMVTIQGHDGDFEGALTNPAGIVLGVKIQKIPEKELSVIKAQQDGPPLIKVVAADVPASCAGFIGGWTGRWPHYGSTWLWVVDIDAQCIATYAHRGGAGLPKASVFRKAEITNGILSCPDDQGAIDSFELHGDELWAKHSGSDGSNNTVFRKVSIETK